MKFIDAIFSGSIFISGSFNPPMGTRQQRPTNPVTASVFFETSDSGSRLLIYHGSGSDGWQEVGLQSDPIPPPPPIPKADIEYLVIGGGGSGGQLGGGGAGGYLSSSLANVTSGSSLTVTVGGGGSPITNIVRGNTGTDSSIEGTGYTTVTALGGGGGGGQGSATDAGTGKDGGSGGGGGENDAGTNTPGSGTVGQGNDGGTGGTGAGTQLSGGGGGGAGVEGSDAAGQSSGGAGGNGLASKITGTSVTRSGGGGGGAWWYNNGGSSYGGAGGSGGGGAAGTTGNTAAVSGTANTGGGGGGAGFTSAGWWITDSGTGGSGVVILAYDSGSINGVGGIVGDAGNGRKYNQFNTSGTFKVGSTSDFGIVTSNLVGHYDAGNFASRGASTWTDLTGNNNGTAAGNPVLNNFYYEFDGTGDYFNLGYNTNYTEFTVEAWVNSDNAGLADYQTIVGKWWDGSNRGFALYMINNTFRVDIAYTDENSDHIFDHGTTVTDTWHHVVFGWKNQEGYIFSADNSVTTASVSKDVRTNTQNWFIGEQDYRVLKEWDGEIAQVRIYNRKLTSSEISQNYNATKTNFV